MNKEIFCTLGPASMNDRVIARLEALGVSLFRINLSHTKLGDVADVIDYVQSRTNVPLCLDTEGAQIRTATLLDGATTVHDNAVIRVARQPVPGDALRFNLHPANAVDLLEIGDFISIDFNTLLAQVIEREPDAVVLRVLNGGAFGSNKAVTVERSIPLPPLTEKDHAALAIGRDKGIRYVALSFANHGDDLGVIREAAGPESFIIAKIESRNGLANLDAIAQRADALLIDRGDLSREVPIERIPAMQKWIIGRAKVNDRKVYVATNLLESMITAPGPTRAEVNDVYNTLLDGADGLVLAAETAIGANPIGCATMIVKMIREFSADGQPAATAADHYDPSAASLLIEPHGGDLVHREAVMPGDADLPRLRLIAVDDKALMDCAQIAAGTFSPLTGFMGRETLDGVLDRHRLPDGTVWPMPIVLQLDQDTCASLGSGERIGLTDRDGQLHSLLDIDEVYSVDIDSVAERWFGTTDDDHPGVGALKAGGPWLVGGAISQVAPRATPQHHYQLTPAQTRFIFAHKGWHRVVGFHTRNVIHRAHEHIQLAGLEASGADGLLISPVIGPKKDGDFLPEPIMKSYQMMMDFRLFPPGKVVVGSLATYPRYAGPREAVFTALCRKNLGCSHFIVGRDHAGVGAEANADATRRIFDAIGDIGIEPLFFDAVGYNPTTGRYEAADRPEVLQMISGTEMRQALRENRPLPDWFMRDIIQDMLRAELAAGRQLFC